ncbi:hypothetical protein [Legionella sp. WA2022007384]
MHSRTIFASNLKGGGPSSRSLWTRAQSYPTTFSSQWTIEMHCFPTSTFFGKRLHECNLFSLFSMPRSYNLAFRGMSKLEADCEYNQRMHGLVGRSPRSFRIEEKESEMLEHQRGNIKGISTSRTLSSAKSFANRLAKDYEIMVMDLENIPEEELYHQKYIEGAMGVNSTGEPTDYSHENECTLSAAHISSCVARVNRKNMLAWDIEYNPLYVDQKLLSSELKLEFKQVLHTFYDLIQTKKPDPDEVKKYGKIELDFYLKVAQELDYSEEHKAAIVSYLSGGKSLELFEEMELETEKKGPDLK